MPLWKRNLYIVWFGLFFNHIAYTLSVPFFPLFLEQELGVHSGLTAWAGVSISISFLIGGLCAPFWGSLADKHGSKLMLVRSGVGLALAHFANYFVYDPFSFLLVRVFQGLMAGFSPAAIALVGTNTPEKHVGYALGVTSTATAAGGILGPLFGGALSHWIGLRGCFVASGILTVGSALVVLAVKEIRDRRETARSSVRQDLRRAAGTPNLMRVYGLILLAWTSVLVLEPLLTLHVARLGGDPDNATLSSGIVFSAIGVATVIMGPRWGKIGGRVGYGKILLIGLVGGAIGNVLQAAMPNLVGFGLLRFGYGLLYAAVYPALSALVIRYADADFRGRAVGLSTTAMQFGIVAGPLIGGFLGGWMPIPYVFALTGLALLAAAYGARNLGEDDRALLKSEQACDKMQVT